MTAQQIDREIIRCVFCDDEIPAEELTTCAACSTPYHLDCWRWAGSKCQMLGCVPQREVPQGSQPTPTIRSLGSLRIDPRDVTSRLRHARRNVPVADHVSAVWRPLAPSLIAGAFSALAVCMLVRGIGAALLWAMGPEQFAKQYAVEILYRASKFAWLWGVCGVCYGWLHRQHVRTEAGWLSYLLRRFIFAATLAVMGFLLGYLVLVPAFAWSTRVPPLAWVPSLAIPLALFWLVVGAATGIRVYFTKESVFTLILVEGIGFLVLGAAGIGNALVSGYFLGGLCWILGWLIDLPLHYFIHADPASTGFKWGCGIGGLVGFANGLSAILKKQLNR